MTPAPQTPPTGIDQAFVADRQLFWDRFTGFTKWAVIAVVALLVLLWVFLV